MSNTQPLPINAILGEEEYVFDAVEASEYSDTVPAGMYKVTIIGNEIIEGLTKDEFPIAHNVLRLQFSIQEPVEQKGFRLSKRYNLNHPVERQRNISRKMFGELCKAVGVTKLTNTTQILQKELMTTVSLREYNGRNYNDIGKVESLEGADALGVDITPDYETPAQTQPSPAPATASEPIPPVASEELGF